MALQSSTLVPSQQTLILASTSPRRKQLLESCFIKFEIYAPNIEEAPKQGESAQDYCMRNAKEKAQAIANKLEHFDILPFILSADTIVVTTEGKILEKPTDKAHASSMLKSLSANTHNVFTGYSLFHGKKECVTKLVETKVTFRSLTDEEIDAYIATGEVYDKAGSYGIQGLASGFVEKINGSYTNVMGLPLSQVLEDLKTYAGIKTYE